MTALAVRRSHRRLFSAVDGERDLCLAIGHYNCRYSSRCVGVPTMTPNMYWYLFVFARMQEKIPSGIDMVIYIEAPRETVLQRSLGRLFDPYTGEK